MAITPTATGTQVADIFYGDFAASLPGVTANDTFSVLWEGWFDVTKDGTGDYTFGTVSDDGSVIYLDLNNDGDFTDPGELVVNNNGAHGLDQIRTATVNLPMDSVRIAIGYFEAGGGEGLDARFQRGKGLAFTALQRIGGRTGHFRATEPASNPASSALWYVTSSGRVAQPYGSPTQLLLLLPVGTPVDNLAPAFTLSPGATCVPPLGNPLDFSTPQTYTVTAGDGFTQTVYTVIARAATPVSVKTYAATAGTGYLAPISNLQAVTPSGTGEIFDDINYASDASFTALPGLTGLTPVDGFSVLWEGWFNVAADGPGDYTFGTRSDDGSVLYLDLSNDGDFDDPGEIIVNNNALQGATTRTTTIKLLMDKVRFAIGFFDNGGGQAMEARFGKGSGVAWENLWTVSGNTGLFSIAEPASKPSSSALWYFNYAGVVAVPTNPEGTNLLLVLPLGHDVTALNPGFIISPGAVCTPPSGTTRNFSTPQSYSVTSADSSTTTEYTVTIYTGQVYDFNNGTLQGWQNRVWDLAANGGTGGWIELAPNATTMPATVNGGAIQPPSVDNGLFTVNAGEVVPTGNQDNHLNTLWLRSPAFYLDAVADLTLQLRRGVANTANPASEAAVPFAAVTGGGWKGAVLRRVSDGAFLLAKPRTGTNGDEARTITFTKAELTPYDGVACTLELINSDRGTWGWMSMDNVFIPATSLVPVPPYDSWRAQYPTLVGAAGAPGGDAESDGSTNLEEYAFATNPMNGTLGPITYAAGSVSGHGQPVLDITSGFAAVFGRRLDRVARGLTYTVQFSADLQSWENNTAEPTVLAADAEIEAVSVPFPATINPGNPVVPHFFRILVRQN
jgi:hypothetical protein